MVLYKNPDGSIIHTENTYLGMAEYLGISTSTIDKYIKRDQSRAKRGHVFTEPFFEIVVSRKRPEKTYKIPYEPEIPRPERRSYTPVGTTVYLYYKKTADIGRDDWEQKKLTIRRYYPYCVELVDSKGFVKAPCLWEFWMRMRYKI